MSGLTSMIFNMGLTHLGSEASNYGYRFSLFLKRVSKILTDLHIDIKSNSIRYDYTDRKNLNNFSIFTIEFEYYLPSFIYMYL